jgi:hypothetical protein
MQIEKRVLLDKSIVISLNRVSKWRREKITMINTDTTTTLLINIHTITMLSMTTIKTMGMIMTTLINLISTKIISNLLIEL